MVLVGYFLKKLYFCRSSVCKNPHTTRKKIIIINNKQINNKKQMKKLLTLFALAIMLGVQNANAFVHTALSGSNWNANEGPAKLFDGTTNTKWGTHDDDPYVVFKTSLPIKATSYKLVIAGDTHDHTGRNWKKWEIYAGNFSSEADATRDAAGWVLIDSKDENLPTAQFEEVPLTLSNADADNFYNYYKIEVKELSGDWTNYCQMDGFSFTDATYPLDKVDFTYVKGQSNTNNTNEGMNKLFDDCLTTKYCGNASNVAGADVCYAIVEASQAVYMWGYEMTTANDNEQYGRCVSKWSLYGSNDENAKNDATSSSWVQLSSLGGFVQQKNNYTQRFFCDKNTVGTAYKYFKVTLDDGGFVQLTKFNFCYDKYSTVTYDWYASSDDRKDPNDPNSDPNDSRKAVDWLLGRKWEGNNLAGNWVTIKTSDDTPHSVKSYSFTTHDDGRYGDRAPKSWTIEGSNDNSTWTTIDEVTDGKIDNLNYKTFDYTPSNVSDSFKYIKLTLNAMKGTGWTQVGEFHVVGACQTHTWVNTTYVAPTCVADGGGEQQCSVCGVTRLTGVEPATGNHTYDANGICTVCNQPNPNFMTLNEGFYEPTTVEQFNWLKAMIQGGATVNIRLTQDVDLTGFAGFGNGEEANDHIVPFSGEFDGGGHWLKNLNINVVKKNTGLFGLTNGANIHDLGFDKANVKVNGTQNVGIIVGNAKNTTFNRVAIMKGSKVEGFDHVGAFVGNTEGTCVISNCITDAEVYSTVYQAGGFVGTSSGLTLEKSLFLGSVRCGNGAGDVGGFISRIEKDNATTIQNNIMAATMLTTAKTTITPLVAQHTKTTYENNHVAASTIFKSTHNDASAELKAGMTMEFDDLNGYQGKTAPDADMKCKSFYTTTMGWDMTNDWKFIAAGQYPVLVWMEGTATQAVTVSDAGYATIVAEAELEIPEGVEVFAAQVNGSSVHLEPITGSIPAGEAVVVKANAGTYNFPYAVEYAAAVAGNELIAATEAVTANGTQYCLAAKNGAVGFYRVKEEIVIPAGKAYLVISAGVKSFYGFEEDEATAIEMVEGQSSMVNGSIFNLAGQRMSKAQKGINIINGKKVLY